MSEFTCLAKDIPGAEGPCVSREGRLFMVCPRQGQVLEVLPDQVTRELANTGGVPAGLQIDRNNDIWVADMKLGVLRVSLDGRVFPEVTEYDGKPMRGCNDCYFDSTGNLYFTAPAGSNAKELIGEIYCRLADGVVRKLDGGYAFCNGLAVTVDDKTLIVAETMTRSLIAYDIEEPGVVSNKRLWSKLPDTGLGPDGMDFDARGRLLVAHFDASAVEVYESDGAWSGNIATPFAQVTNVHFLGSAQGIGASLVITEMSSGGLWQCEWDTPGQLQYGLG